MGKCNSTKVGKTGLEFKGCKDRYGMGMWKAIRNRWESFMSRSHFMVAMEEE